MLVSAKHQHESAIEKKNSSKKEINSKTIPTPFPIMSQLLLLRKYLHVNLKSFVGQGVLFSGVKDCCPCGFLSQGILTAHGHCYRLDPCCWSYSSAETQIESVVLEAWFRVSLYWAAAKHHLLFAPRLLLPYLLLFPLFPYYSLLTAFPFFSFSSLPFPSFIPAMGIRGNEIKILGDKGERSDWDSLNKDDNFRESSSVSTLISRRDGARVLPGEKA